MNTPNSPSGNNEPSNRPGEPDSLSTTRITVPRADSGSGLPRTADLPEERCIDLLEVYRRALGAVHPTDTGPVTFPQPFGRFVLLGVLGRGGQGTVFRAADPQLEREVALKVPHPGVLWSSEMRQRFFYEGRAAALLDHPNIVPVYEAGEVDGVCYLAAAHCPGETLARWLHAHRGPVPMASAVRLVAGLADGVDHAHRRGVLHRDLKPGNVLLSPGPECPRVTDFGLARLAQAGEDNQTATGEIIGTPGYLAPEQAAGDNRRIGTHTDIYALGTILYEVLTGARPFAAADRAEAIRLAVAGDIPTPLRAGRRLPPDLESVCLKCLDRDPSRRYQTARELADDLRRFLAGEPVLARPRGLAGRLVRWGRRRPATAGFAGASALAAALLVAAAAWHAYQIDRKNSDLRDALVDAQRERGRAAEQRNRADARANEARLLAYSGRMRLAGQLLKDGQQGLMSDVLAQLRPEPRDPDHREFVWGALWNLGRNDQWLRGNPQGVSGTAFSADGRTLYSVQSDGEVFAWDPGTGLARRRVPAARPGRPTGLALAPDGTRAAAEFVRAGRERELRVWVPDTGAVLATLPFDSGFRRSDVALAGDYVAAARDAAPGTAAGAVVLWDWRSGATRHLLPDLTACTALAADPAGRVLAAAGPPDPAGRSVVRLLALPGGEELGALPPTGGYLDALTFSPDGRTLAGAGHREALVLWDVGTRRERLRAAPLGETTHALGFLDGGSRVMSLSLPAGDLTVAVRVRDAATGAEVVPAARVLCDADLLALNPAGGRYAVTHQSLVRLRRLWPEPTFAALPGHDAEVWAAAFTPDGGSVVTTSDDGTAVVRGGHDLSPRATYYGHSVLVSCAATAPVGGWVATGSYDGSVHLWEAASGCPLRTLTGHTKAVRAVAVSPDGKQVASGGKDQTTRLWDAASGRLLRAWDHPTFSVRALSFTPDGRHLVAGGQGRALVVFDLRSGAEVRYESAVDIWCLAVTADGAAVLTGGNDGELRLWDRATGAHRVLTGGHRDGILGLAISPDGRTAATAGQDRSVRLWHLPTGIELCAFDGLPSAARCVAFAPDGSSLVAGLHDGRLLVWHAAAR